ACSGLRKLLYAVASFCGPPQASIRRRKLLWRSASLWTATASFYGAPQASIRRRKLLWRAASLWTATASFCGIPRASIRRRKLLRRAASLWTATASFYGTPQASIRRRKLLWRAASLWTAAASFYGTPQASIRRRKLLWRAGSKSARWRECAAAYSQDIGHTELSSHCAVEYPGHEDLPAVLLVLSPPWRPRRHTAWACDREEPRGDCSSTDLDRGLSSAGGTRRPRRLREADPADPSGQVPALSLPRREGLRLDAVRSRRDGSAPAREAVHPHQGRRAAQADPRLPRRAPVAAISLAVSRASKSEQARGRHREPGPFHRVRSPYRPLTTSIPFYSNSSRPAITPARVRL